MSSKSLHQLKNLKLKLNNQKMSVLIGAGFSKNVSNKYPSWWELLYDLVIELYKPEIEEKYQLLNLSKTKKSAVNKDLFYEKKVDEIISRIGYLQIVSNYINWKGYREAITNYIEERTPLVTREQDQLKIIYKKNGTVYSESLQINDLKLHKKLIQLPWNNIYTTNYDNLIESTIDLNIENKINALKLEIENNLVALQKEKIIKEELKVVEESKHLHSTNNNISQELDNNTPNPKTKKITETPFTLNQELVNLNGRIEEINRVIKLNEIDQNVLEKALDDCLNVVTHSSHLKIKRNKNIIKLHGTLRDNEQKSNGTFGFDGDFQKHYVIAKEDFETYPRKHEAFTQLMRISLLQESYCLIGFSGADPNFIAWINWVRDIIERKEDDNKNKEYKIYLVDFGDKNIPEDKLLFYENHRIVRISLNDPETITFLEKENNHKIADKSDKKSLLESLLNYLSDGTNINESKSIIEKISLKKYDNLWNTIHFPYTGEVTTEIFSKVLQQFPGIKLLSGQTRIPSVGFSSTGNKNDLLYFAIRLLKDAEKIRDFNFSEQLLELFIVAFKETFVPIQAQWTTDEFKVVYRHLGSNQLLRTKYLLLALRNHLLNNDKSSFKKTSKEISVNNTDEINNALEYENLLLLAYNFNFLELFNRLSRWTPNSYWIIKKAGLLALFDTEKSEKILAEFVLNFEDESNQEQLIALEIYSYIKQNNSLTFSNELKQKINAYTNNGLISTKTNFEYLIEELGKKRTELKPYGDKKFSTSNKISFSKGSSGLYSIQFLQLMLETGFPLSSKHFYYEDPEDWYMVFKNIFEQYPYPVLFYSLQYSKEDFIRRIAQDYSYSIHLVKEVEELCELLLNKYLIDSTPKRYKQSILYFVSELFNALPATKWESKFLKVWKILVKNNRVFVDKHRSDYTFIAKGLVNIQNPKILQSVISDILKHFDNRDISIDYLYQIALNPHLSKLVVRNESILFKQIGNLISKIPLAKETALFAIGNLNQIIPKILKNRIVDQISGIDFKILDSYNIWRVLLYYGESNAALSNRIKIGIINSKYLWFSGINEDNSVSMGGATNIELHRLEKTPTRKHGIVWSKKETFEIFKKLKSSFLKIEHTMVTKPDLKLFDSVLEEMLYFLKKHKNYLASDLEYGSILTKCETAYSSQKGYSELLEGLASSDSKKVILGLGELNKLLYYDKFEEGRPFLILLLNKILLKSPDGLEATLSYVSFWFYDLKHKKSLKDHQYIILDILKKYSNEDLTGFEIPFVEENLIKLALVLHYWKIKSPSIEYWLKKKKESQFNNIKFMKI